MKKITIKGHFTGLVNNFVTVDVYTTNSSPNSSPSSYNFSKTFTGNFEEDLIDLKADSIYRVGFSGYTSGQFKLEVNGEFQNPNPLTKTYSAETFNVGYKISTNQ